jgi:hypothetical protein
MSLEQNEQIFNVICVKDSDPALAKVSLVKRPSSDIHFLSYCFDVSFTTLSIACSASKCTPAFCSANPLQTA